MPNDIGVVKGVRVKACDEDSVTCGPEEYVTDVCRVLPNDSKFFFSFYLSIYLFYFNEVTAYFVSFECAV